MAANVSTWIMILYLFAVLLFPLGSQSMYDAPAAMGDDIKTQYSMSDQQYGLLYSAYAFPNLLISFMAGPFVDWVGPNIASIIFSAIIFTGPLQIMFTIVKFLCLQTFSHL
jgi:hypothetical protein